MNKNIANEALITSISINVFDILVGDFGKIPTKSIIYTIKYKTEIICAIGIAYEFAIKSK
jgi:hypothetical protein